MKLQGHRKNHLFPIIRRSEEILNIFSIFELVITSLKRIVPSCIEYIEDLHQADSPSFISKVLLDINHINRIKV
jgi:hypothetical protein